MSGMQHKLTRIERLRSMEQNKLNSLAVELSAIELQIAEQGKQLTGLKNQMEKMSTNRDSYSVDAHQQAMLWVEHLQSQAVSLKQKIQETESKRNEIRNTVMEQKTKVRGWELYIDRLSAEAAGESERQESLIADDRHLNNPMTR
ncbi:MAG: hypothetical protein HKN47_29720 [Pirellulaceae bacterium]|nr:hypothetical protein [Pirellulaceae bacterium]